MGGRHVYLVFKLLAIDELLENLFFTLEVLCVGEEDVLVLEKPLLAGETILSQHDEVDDQGENKGQDRN